MKIIDWQAHFTEHQSYTWLALQELVDEKIVHVVAATSSDTRDKQGWHTLDLSEMEIVKFKGEGWWKQGIGILKQYPDAIHVFGGFWADRRFFPLILYAVWCGYKVVVMNEAYATEPVGYLSNSSRWRNRLNVFLRPILYRLVALVIKALSSPNRFCFLGLSAHATEQFECAGFSHSQVFPFGYFVPGSKSPSDTYDSATSAVRFIFVGALLKRKGLDLVVSALESLNIEGLPVSLDVYGHGEAADYINSNSQCVSYKGTIPFGQAQGVISEYDALILPSLHDGWGVVVNEALLQGVPAIVSSNVGAKCMIENSGAGMVFESGDAGALKNILSEFCSNASLRNEQRRQAGLIGALITPKNAARYLIDVFDYYFLEQCELPKEIWRYQSKKTQGDRNEI